jgi:phosphoenolpyruvate carboxykinase (diphosphate)
LPELFMDVICSLTGKSPSTTGAGSEGALTKGPFNALRTIVDLNASLVSSILTGLAGFSTAAGYVGPHRRIDHDVSLLIPEIWCRLTARERDPASLIAEGHLEPLHDFEHAGRQVLASRLGYRITARFVRAFFGRVFDHPDRVFDEAFLRPESQDLEAFVDGVHNITEAQHRVASQAFEDGSIEDACPPLRALLSVMAHGTFEGRDAHHPAIRQLFTREALQGSDWYQRRLAARRRGDERLWRRHVTALDAWLAANAAAQGPLTAEMRRRREHATTQLHRVTTPDYLESLRGTLGTDPSLTASREGH